MSGSPTQAPACETERALQSERLRGVPPAVCFVWSTFDASTVQIRDERGERLGLPHRLVPHSAVRLARPVPLTLEVNWAQTGPARADPSRTKPGEIVVLEPLPGTQRKVLIKVAEMLPEAVLNDLRRDSRGSLRLKLRLQPDTVELGWDIMRRGPVLETSDPKAATEPYAPPVYTMAGGAVREGPLIDGGQMPRPSWYVDLKTGALIVSEK